MKSLLKMVVALVIISFGVCFYASLLMAELPDSSTLRKIVSGYGSAVVDGSLDKIEWKNGTKETISITLPNGGSTTATLLVMNDSENLYLALRFAKLPFEVVGQALFFEFQNPDIHLSDTGDDVIGMNPNIGFLDEVRIKGSSFIDTRKGGTIDGNGAFIEDDEQTVYEMSHPLKSLDQKHDIQLNEGDSIGFSISLRLMQQGAEYPDGYGDTRIRNILMELAKKKNKKKNKGSGLEIRN